MKKNFILSLGNFDDQLMDIIEMQTQMVKDRYIRFPVILHLLIHSATPVFCPDAKIFFLKVSLSGN